MKRIAVMIVSIIVTQLAIAGTGESSSGTRGGGDEVGLNFQATAAAAIAALDANRLSPAELESLKIMLDHARYVVVDEALFASIGGAPDFSQESVALNDRGTETIYINRPRWLKIDDFLVRQQIALHELLSLLGIEDTGNYKISSTLNNLEATRLYDRFYDDSAQGLSEESVERACTLQKARFQNQYVIVYCSFMKKEIPQQSDDSTGHHPKITYKTAYGLAVWGLGKRDGATGWITVFSSRNFLNGDFGALEYPAENAARDACMLHLAQTITSEPFWIGARCFTISDGSRHYYEIRTLNLNQGVQK